VRASWTEVNEMMAAAQVHTIERYGPDRIVGFSPIPAMSMVSYAAGTRFLSLIGGTILSFYDWYADLPMASPQVFGDQTDVPESGDWWNAGYLIIWGTNLPITRTPDAHFMVEARYRGQKVVVVSPDYGDHTQFADDWLAAAPGTDGALAMAMGHVILTEVLYRDRQVPRFVEYVNGLHRPALPRDAREHGDAFVPDRFLTAADLGDTDEGAEVKTVLLDERTGERVVPNGSIGFRWTESGQGRWNLELGAVDPVLTLLGRHDEAGGGPVDLPRFDVGDTEGGGAVRLRGVPAVRVGDRLVIHGLPTWSWPSTPSEETACGRVCPRLRRPVSVHAAWQEELTSCRPRRPHAWPASSPATPRSRGRSMIAKAPAPTIGSTRPDLPDLPRALALCGCEG